MSISVPRRTDDITREWLSNALGVIVDAVTITEVINGTATKVRLALDYGEHTQLPAAMCFKGGMGESAEIMASVGIYASEARFFRDELSHCAVRAPDVYWAELDGDFGGILMEDLKRPSVWFCSARTPLTVDQTSAVLDNVAVLHASRWNSPWLDEADWLEDFDNPNSRGNAYFAMWSAEPLAQLMNEPNRRSAVPELLRDPSRSVDLFWKFVASSGAGPRTLLHGDCHVGNVYFDGERAAICDWQTARRGCPAFDVAYLIGSAVTTPVRREAEAELIRRYLAALGSYGVLDAPAFNEMWELYRIHMAYGYFAWLTNLETFQPPDLIKTTLERFGAAVVDLRTEQALGLGH